MNAVPDPVRCACPGRSSAGPRPIDPGCLVHNESEAWPAPPPFEDTLVRFTSHASRGSWNTEAACLRCGAQVPTDMDPGSTSSGGGQSSGTALHARWHLEQDWHNRVGPKAPLYAAAGYTLARAAAAEQDAPLTVADLRVAAALIEAGLSPKD